MIEWQNLDLKVGGSATAGYRVEAAGPAGQQGQAPFRGAALTGLGPALKAIRAGTADRAAMERVGLGLFQALMPLEVRAACVTARDGLAAGQGLRLRLHLPAELDRLPWELIRCPPDYLAASPRLSVVRFLDLPGTPTPLETRLPLRILYLPGKVEGSSGGEPERGGWLAALAGAREEGWVDVVAPRPVTAAALGKAHVVHFAGRAGWEKGRGVLFFETGDGDGQPVDGRVLARLLLKAGIRLAVLSAGGPAGGTGGAWEEVARVLVGAGLPAVVTVRRPLAEGVGPAFVAGLYRALARGRAVDAATGEGRRAAMAALGPAWEEQADWAVPTLLMRAPEGQIWRFQEDAAETEPASRPQPPVIQQQVTALHDAVSIGTISGGTASISLGGGAGAEDSYLDRMRAEGRTFDELREVPYDLAALRSLLAAAFRPQELYRFCQNHPFLRPVIHEFSPQHGLNEMVDRVIGYCWTRGLWDELLAAVEEENSAQYARFAPHLRASSAERGTASLRSQAGGDPLSGSLADLRQVVRDYAAGDKRDEALAQVAALEAAAGGERPDLEALDAILTWFEAQQPALAGPVLATILSAEPRIQKLGDDLLIEFRERFRRRP